MATGVPNGALRVDASSLEALASGHNTVDSVVCAVITKRMITSRDEHA
jgi:hypothetical protein